MKHIILILILSIFLINHINRINSKVNHKLSNKFRFRKFKRTSELSREKKFKFFFEGFMKTILKQISDVSIFSSSEIKEFSEEAVGIIGGYLTDKCGASAMKFYNSHLTKNSSAMEKVFHSESDKKVRTEVSSECSKHDSIQSVENGISGFDKLFSRNKNIQVQYDDRSISREELLKIKDAQEKTINHLTEKVHDMIENFLKRKQKMFDADDKLLQEIKETMEINFFRIDSKKNICEVEKDLQDASPAIIIEGLIWAALEGFKCTSKYIQDIYNVDKVLNKDSLIDFRKVCKFDLFREDEELYNIFCQKLSLISLVEFKNHYDQIKERSLFNFQKIAAENHLDKLDKNILGKVLDKKQICGIIELISKLSPQITEIKDIFCSSLSLNQLELVYQSLKQIDSNVFTHLNKENFCSILDKLSIIKLEGDLIIAFSTIHFVYCNDKSQEYLDKIEEIRSMITDQKNSNLLCKIINVLNETKFLSNDLEIFAYGFKEFYCKDNLNLENQIKSNIKKIDEVILKNLSKLNKNILIQFKEAQLLSLSENIEKISSLKGSIQLNSIFNKANLCEILHLPFPNDIFFDIFKKICGINTDALDYKLMEFRVAITVILNNLAENIKQISPDNFNYEKLNEKWKSLSAYSLNEIFSFHKIKEFSEFIEIFASVFSDMISDQNLQIRNNQESIYRIFNLIKSNLDILRKIELEKDKFINDLKEKSLVEVQSDLSDINNLNKEIDDNVKESIEEFNKKMENKLKEIIQNGFQTLNESIETIKTEVTPFIIEVNNILKMLKIFKNFDEIKIPSLLILKEFYIPEFPNPQITPDFDNLSDNEYKNLQNSLIEKISSEKQKILNQLHGEQKKFSVTEFEKLKEEVSNTFEKKIKLIKYLDQNLSKEKFCSFLKDYSKSINSQNIFTFIINDAFCDGKMIKSFLEIISEVKILKNSLNEIKDTKTAEIIKNKMLCEIVKENIESVAGFNVDSFIITILEDYLCGTSLYDKISDTIKKLKTGFEKYKGKIDNLKTNIRNKTNSVSTKITINTKYDFKLELKNVLEILKEYLPKNPQIDLNIDKMLIGAIYSIFNESFEVLKSDGRNLVQNHKKYYQPHFKLNIPDKLKNLLKFPEQELIDLQKFSHNLNLNDKISIDLLKNFIQPKLSNLNSFNLENISLIFFNEFICNDKIRSAENLVKDQIGQLESKSKEQIEALEHQIMIKSKNIQFESEKLNELNQIYKEDLCKFKGIFENFAKSDEETVELLKFLFKILCGKLKLNIFNKFANIDSLIVDLYKNLAISAATNIFPIGLVYFAAKFILKNISYIAGITSYLLFGDGKNDIEGQKLYNDLGSLLGNQIGGLLN